MPVQIRLAIAALLLFAVVAIDFVSSIMSIAFDAGIVFLLVTVIWPIARDSLKKQS